MKVYAGIGSRKTPAEITTLMFKIGHKLADLGYGLRSGGAEGADRAFLEGALQSTRVKSTPTEIFIPWSGFGDIDGQWFTVDASRLTNHSEALEIASHFHPVWERLKDSVRALHARNVYQVLGRDLESPSSRVICYAKPVKDGYKVKGGTATAVAIARHFNIPVLNLYLESDFERAVKFIEDT